MICCIENRIQPSGPQTRIWDGQENKTFDSTMNSIDILKVHLHNLEEQENELQFFGKRKAPEIFESSFSLGKIIAEMFRYNLCDHYILTSACIYVRNISKSYEITPKNLNRFIFVSIMIAHKFACDIPYSNDSFSTISGLSICVLAEMELFFLNMIGFRLFLSRQDIECFIDIVKNTKEDKLNIEYVLFSDETDVHACS